MAHGTLILVIGPTGSGKSMLMRHAIEAHPELELPYSYTTRAKREGIVENDHYRFVSREEFEARIERGEFLEWAEYGGNYYGTLKGEVLDALASGKVLLKEMEVQGARQVRAVLPPEQLVTVFIDAGSWEELERRVRARAPMTEEELAKRKHRHEDEMTFKPEADIVVENHPGKAEEAKAAFSAVVERALSEAAGF